MRVKLASLLPGLCGAVLAAGLGGLLVNSTLGRGLIHLSYDIPLAVRHAFRPVPVPAEAAIIYLDDQSAERLGQPLSRPWDRSLHARLLERLTADGAKSVTYDIFFADPSPPEKRHEDAQFAQAMKASGRAILGANPYHVGYEHGALARGKEIKPPFELVAEHAANLASVEMNPDNDLVVRQHLVFGRDDLVPPLAWAAAELAGAAATKSAEVRATDRWLNYYGPPRTIPTLTFYQVISKDPNDHPPPPGFFRDKSVFVGGGFITHLASDRKDEFATPFWILRPKQAGAGGALSQLRFMAGVEVHATVFLNLLRGEWLTRTSDRTETWLMLGCGVACGCGFTRMRPVRATLAALLAVLAFAVAGHVSALQYRLWFPWAIPVFTIVPAACAWSVVYNSVSLYVQKRLLEQSLARYLSPKLVKIFANRPEFLRTGAEKQNVTILFSDIANFTSLSEGMDSDELARLVNRYFDRAIPSCIFKTDGTVMKYIGDAIFAIWNAPEAQPDHELRACRAALLLRDQLGDFTLEGGSSTPLRTRIGLHTGVANVGNFGSTERFGYDAIGENINLASRMEGLNKYLGTDVLITGDTHRAIAGQLVTRPLGAFRLKGFEKAVEVVELVSELDRAAASQAWRDAFAQALAAFTSRSFDDAEVAFRRTLALKPGDGPARFYLERIAELREQTLSAEWTGVTELKEK